MHCNAVVDKEQYDELMSKYLELAKQTLALQNLNDSLTKERDSWERAYTRAKDAYDEEAVERRRYSQQVDMYEKMFAKAQNQADNATELVNRYKELVKQYKEENRLLTQRIKERDMSCDSSSSTFSQTIEETFK
mgnify:CR=1 FL=1